MTKEQFEEFSKNKRIISSSEYEKLSGREMYDLITERHNPVYEHINLPENKSIVVVSQAYYYDPKLNVIAWCYHPVLD